MTRTRRPSRARTLTRTLLAPSLALLVGVGCDAADAGDGPDAGADDLPYRIVATGQQDCYQADGAVIACPAAGERFHGQDAQHDGNPAVHVGNGDGTVTDAVTGLTWQASPDTDGDGVIDARDKLTFDEALVRCDDLTLAGHDDWRLPDIKQLYSLIDFRGTDPSGYDGTDTAGLTPFLDTDAFAFGYGDTAAGERIIDAQYASRTLYVAHTANDGGRTLFGVNFADGRIKGYGLTLFGEDKTFYVICVRGNDAYGVNDLVDGGDGTITDRATGLTWAQDDSHAGMDWEAALAWVDARNADGYLGHDDWRLPDAKELQSLVDYTRSPTTTASAAIDARFATSAITDEAGDADFPAYWTSTTHATWAALPGTAGPGAASVYVTFGRAMGYMNGGWVDVHGAGAQRSDPKAGDAADYPTGRGPQGDAIRIQNHVRLVRDADR
ncbi:MAG: DUF1566 domain-containing protein [Kofleriaceae bacterium]|nr:DUF1566 domain-containing protein [Kofleriaceae bacterium]